VKALKPKHRYGCEGRSERWTAILHRAAPIRFDVERLLLQAQSQLQVWVKDRKLRIFSDNVSLFKPQVRSLE
jgi:hypothetical protein